MANNYLPKSETVNVLSGLNTLYNHYAEERENLEQYVLETRDEAFNALCQAADDLGREQYERVVDELKDAHYLDVARDEFPELTGKKALTSIRNNLYLTLERLHSDADDLVASFDTTVDDGANAIRETIETTPIYETGLIEYRSAIPKNIPYEERCEGIKEHITAAADAFKEINIILDG